MKKVLAFFFGLALVGCTHSSEEAPTEETPAAPVEVAPEAVDEAAPAE